MLETWHIVTGTSVLTDTLFVDYGGNVSTSNGAQRRAAYMIAEQFAIEEIGTFLVPTTVTGTFSWPIIGNYPTADYRFQLPHSHVTAVPSLTTIHDAGCDCASNAVELSGCAWILDGDNGVIDLRECGNTLQASCAGCSCGGGGSGPMQFRAVYTAGIPTGLVANSPTALLGLVTAADLALEQIIDPSGAEGGPGDPSVQSYSDTGYSETRQFLRMTAFGGSARANYAAKCLAPFKVKGALKL